MKSRKAFFGLIFVISIFGAAKFFELDKNPGSNAARASLEAAQEVNLQLAGDVVFRESYDNLVNSKTEILADPKSQNLESELDVSAASDKGNCFENSGARYYLVKFAGGGDVLASYGENNRWPIASVSKLMSAVVAGENLDLSKSIEIAKEMLEPEGSAGDFKIGERFLGKDMLKAGLLISSNDAVEALAVSFGKSEFVDIMNKKAQELRMEDTFFADPSGLSIKNQSTPNDIYRLINYIVEERPEILSLTKAKSFDLVNLANNKKRKIFNMNEFAGQAGFMGGKTGFIPESGGNLVSVFDYGDQKLIVIVFDSQDRFGSTRKILSCLK